MSHQTTTPSGALVCPLSVMDEETGLMQRRAFSRDELERHCDARTAVAALVARNAELEAERDALRIAGKVMRDALDWYASDPRVWVSFAPKEYERDFSAAMASAYLTRIEDDERGHPQFVPNERKAEEALLDAEAALARTPAKENDACDSAT